MFCSSDRSLLRRCVYNLCFDVLWRSPIMKSKKMKSNSTIISWDISMPQVHAGVLDVLSITAALQLVKFSSDISGTTTSFLCLLKFSATAIQFSHKLKHPFALSPGLCYQALYSDPDMTHSGNLFFVGKGLSKRLTMSSVAWTATFFNNHKQFSDSSTSQIPL